VSNELVDFDKRAWVQKQLNALASSLFTLGVLLSDGRITTCMYSLVIAVAEVLNLASRG
jgi:hypothetical protein